MLRIALLIALLLPGVALAQAPSFPAKTTPLPGLIATGNTFQVIAAADMNRRSLTIQNNNASDSCQLLVGGPWQAGDTASSSRTVNGASLTAAQASIALTAGMSYTRYFPYVPNDAILITCATTGDSYYADVQ